MTDTAEPGSLPGTAGSVPGGAGTLAPLVYGELRKLAAARMRGLGPGQTLQPTALVHEVFIKLAGSRAGDWDGRRHFFGSAARAMRDILVDHARQRAALKRGGGQVRIDFTSDLAAVGPRSDELVALDEALEHLEAKDPRKAELVNLRYFAGFTAAEAADVLGVSVGTVERDWRYVRAYLAVRLRDQAEQVRDHD